MRQADWDTSTVDAVVFEYQPQTMYNFTVGTAHTYFVGDGQSLVHNACETGKGPYSHLEDLKHVGPGKNFTPAQKKKIIEENKKRNNGEVRSDLSGKKLVVPQKSKRGVTPDPDEWQVDRAKGSGGQQ